MWSEGALGQVIQLDVKVFQLFDLCFQFDSTLLLSIAASIQGEGFNASKFGFAPLAQEADVLGADFGQQVSVEFVVINQSGEGGFIVARVFFALDLPGNGALFKLFDMVLKKLGFHPLLKGFANDLGKFALG